MSSIYGQPSNRIAVATVNQAQAAATYDLFTASGDVVVWGCALYCTVVGATWTATTIQTNQTTPFVICDATQGARANFTALKNVAITWTQVQKIFIQSGEKVQYTMSGSTGTGTSRCALFYYSVTPGAVLA